VPMFQLPPSIGHAKEDLDVQTFVAQFTIKALDVAVQ
jgi:hypothetical protein